MPDPMTPERLAEVEARVGCPSSAQAVQIGEVEACARAVVEHDAPALLAEVRRLQAAVEPTMTDHLEAARDRLGGLHDHLSRREVALAADDLHAILSAILDHLEEQQTDASIKHGLADAAAGRTEQLGRFTDDEPDPLDECNHADRYDRIDRLGDRRVWCDECDRLRMSARHEAHAFSYGWSAIADQEDDES